MTSVICNLKSAICNLKSVICDLKSGICDLNSVTLSLLILCVLCANSPALEPATCTVTNLRAEAETYASGEYYYRGQAIRFTNCVAYSGASTSSALQNLSGLTLALEIGSGSSSTSFTAVAQVATSGTWYCNATVPTNWTAPYLQFSITDGTNTFIYPTKILRTKAAF